MTHVSPQPTPSRPLILVTGAGRSGTSTVAGTLSMLGFHVPKPYFKANDSNPRGFFESKWPVKFHNRILKRANVGLTDSRPTAFDLVEQSLTEEDAQSLHDFLAGLSAQDQVVVKDPRAVWMPQLWKSVGTANGFDVHYLTMLRHPTEVLGSRKTNYSETRPWMSAWEFAVWNLCGWINGNLLVERQTRGDRRAVVGYQDLLADWRSTMAHAARDMGVHYGVDLEAARPHPVDDFIDGDLRRHATGWDAWELPEELIEIAESVYSAMSALSSDASSSKAIAQLDEVSARYDALYRRSASIAYDTEAAAVRRAVARTKRQERASSTSEPRPAESPPPTLKAWARHRFPRLRKMNTASTRRLPHA